MRPPITVTNVNKHGRVVEGKWFVRVGKRWKTFGQQEWEAGGIAWINSQLVKAE